MANLPRCAIEVGHHPSAESLPLPQGSLRLDAIPPTNTAETREALTQRALAFVRAAFPGSVSRQEVQQHLGIAEVDQILGDLRWEQHIKQAGHGRYVYQQEDDDGRALPGPTWSSETAIEQVLAALRAAFPVALAPQELEKQGIVQPRPVLMTLVSRGRRSGCGMGATGIARLNEEDMLMEKLITLLNQCRFGVYVSVNAHRDMRQTVEEYFNAGLRAFTCQDVAPAVRRRMRELDTLIEVQCAPHRRDTAIRVYHYDVDAALTQALL
jgi:hypothetical protein